MSSRIEPGDGCIITKVTIKDATINPVKSAQSMK